MRGFGRFRLPTWLLALLIGAGVVLVTAPDLTPEPTAADPEAARPAPALTVTATRPQVVDWPVTLAASGPIQPWQEAIVGARVGGLPLAELLVEVGDRVRKGQALARLDAALLKAEEAERLAEWEQAEANRERSQSLKGRGAISDREVLEDVTRARSAAAALERIRLDLANAEVRAPDDGTISARSATLGAVVSTGQELFRMIRQDRLEWRGEATAAQLAQLRPGQPVTLSLPGGQVARATVTRIAQTLDAETRLAAVHAELAPGGPARAGMFARGEIELGRDPALALPARSVVLRDGRTYAPVLTGEDEAPTVSLRRVETGRRRGERVEVVRGLDRQDRVAVEGAGFLADGDVVRVASGPDAPADASAALEDALDHREAPR